MNQNENLILNPDVVEKRRKEKNNLNLPSETSKFFNKGGKVTINYESKGRFSIPETLYFNDFTVEDINNLATSKQEDILENIVTILNNCVVSTEPIKIEDMTLEEFLETLIGIKQQFNSPIHIHRWMCNCQLKEEESERKLCETEIDLSSLKYFSIEEADKKIQEYLTPIFESMTQEEWINFLKNKYPNQEVNYSTYSKEEEIQKIKIKEPIIYYWENTKFEFRLTRVGDLIKGINIAYKQYYPQIKQIQNKKDNSIPLYELKIWKEKEIEKLRTEQMSKASLYARAMSLLKVNDKPLPDMEKIEYFKKMPRQALLDLISFFDKIVFGINDEREMTCNFCGNTERRYLRQDINPIDLLPLDFNTSRKLSKHSRLNIYFGA